MFNNLCINRISGLAEAGELGGILGVVSGEMSGKTSGLLSVLLVLSSSLRRNLTFFFCTGTSGLTALSGGDSGKTCTSAWGSTWGTAGICDSGIINYELAFLAAGESQSEETESITIGLSGVV